MPRAPEDWRRTIRSARAQIKRGEVETAIKILLPALRWRYDTARNQAVHLLASIGRRAQESPVPTLRSAATAVERRSAADALGLMGGSRAVPALLRALRDPNMVVRRSASLALLRLRAGEAVPRIVRLLRDESGGVRVLAAGVLGKFGDSTAVPALIHALRDGKWYVRQAAARALGEIKDVRAVAPLRFAALDPRPAVARAAAVARVACAGAGSRRT